MNRETIRTDRLLQSAHFYNSAVGASSTEIIGLASVTNAGLPIPNGSKILIHSITCIEITATETLFNFRWIIHKGNTAGKNPIIEGCCSKYNPSQDFKIPIIVKDIGTLYITVQNASASEKGIHVFLHYEVISI
jgi:hypothetical protein